MTENCVVVIGQQKRKNLGFLARLNISREVYNLERCKFDITKILGRKFRGHGVIIL